MVALKTSAANRLLAPTAFSTSIIGTKLTFRYKVKCSTSYILGTRAGLYVCSKAAGVKSCITMITSAGSVGMTPTAFNSTWSWTIFTHICFTLDINAIISIKVKYPLFIYLQLGIFRGKTEVFFKWRWLVFSSAGIDYVFDKKKKKCKKPIKIASFEVFYDLSQLLETILKDICFFLYVILFSWKANWIDQTRSLGKWRT
jgi:hypothetical protein